MSTRRGARYEPPVLVDDQGVIPHFPPLQRAPGGGFVPISEEEQRARSDALRRTLRALDKLPDDDPPELWREVMRGIDEGRPHRPLFEGMY